MSIADGMLSELSYEAENTRKLLARVPSEHLGWKPHEKSMTLGQLASHLAEICQWVKPTIDADEMTFDPDSYVPRIYGSAEELVAVHDAAAKDAQAALAGVTDDKMFVPWTLKAGAKVLFTLPRVAVLRSMILSHIVHHRGQLTVYLRLKDVPLPSIYGPSADEQA